MFDLSSIERDIVIGKVEDGGDLVRGKAFDTKQMDLAE